MERNRDDGRLGRFISLVLRHDPSAAGVVLDEQGWVDVQELLAGINLHGYRIDIDALERIVWANSKQRYSFDETHTRIRANQGHSIVVDVQLTEQVPPSMLYHGTAQRFLDSIKNQGILKQQRQYVHLSADITTALSVGKRYGTPVVLRIDAAAMARDGYMFWVSENGVWLCEHIPWKYVEIETPLV
jgi:putative RNA 2'-phosphotransferase